MENALREHANQFNEAVKCLVEAMGMVAENEQRKVLGESMAYQESDFQKLLENNSMTHNQLVDKQRNFFK